MRGLSGGRQTATITQPPQVITKNSANSLLGIRDGKTDRTSRVNEIQNFIRGWASARGLINTDQPICV